MTPIKARLPRSKEYTAASSGAVHATCEAPPAAAGSLGDDPCPAGPVPLAVLARSRVGRPSRAVSTQEARTGPAMPWWVPPRPHWQSGRNAGRHESSRVRAVVTTTRRSPLIRWPPQLAASQISAAARIATKNTTTMRAAGIVRSLWSCLCTSVPLAVDGAGHAAAGEPGAAALAASAAPGSACICRTYACSIRRCAASPLGRSPRRSRASSRGSGHRVVRCRAEAARRCGTRPGTIWSPPAKQPG